MYPRPVQVHYLDGYRLEVTFEDGVRAELDFTVMLRGGGIFEPLKDETKFAQVRINSEAETLAWPGDVDVCPDVLYHIATGATLPGDLPNPPARLVRVVRPPK